MSSIRGSLAHLSDPVFPRHVHQGARDDTSKAALNAFTILLAAELRCTGVEVNAIHPGWVRTAMGSEHAELDVERGARTTIRYASLDADGPTGGFFFLDDGLPW